MKKMFVLLAISLVAIGCNNDEDWNNAEVGVQAPISQKSFNHWAKFKNFATGKTVSLGYDYLSCKKEPFSGQKRYCLDIWHYYDESKDEKILRDAGIPKSTPFSTDREWSAVVDYLSYSHIFLYLNQWQKL